MTSLVLFPWCRLPLHPMYAMAADLRARAQAEYPCSPDIDYRMLLPRARWTSDRPMWTWWT